MDYISFDNSFWTFLHVITYFYPHNPTMDEKKNYYLFLKNFRNFIPCDSCKAHYIEHNNGQNNLNNGLIQNTVPQLTTVERANEQESSTEPTPEQRSEPETTPLEEPVPEPVPAPDSAPAPDSSQLPPALYEYINSSDYLQSVAEAEREPETDHLPPATLPTPATSPLCPEYIHSNEMLNDEYINSLDYLKSKENLSRSMVDFHNMVNKKLNKPEYTYDESTKYYEKIMENSVMLKKSNLFPKQ
jgi:hypothetical protein